MIRSASPLILFTLLCRQHEIPTLNSECRFSFLPITQQLQANNLIYKKILNFPIELAHNYKWEKHKSQLTALYENCSFSSNEQMIFHFENKILEFNAFCDFYTALTTTHRKLFVICTGARHSLEISDMLKSVLGFKIIQENKKGRQEFTQFAMNNPPLNESSLKR